MTCIYFASNVFNTSEKKFKIKRTKINSFGILRNVPRANCLLLVA